MVAHRLRPKQSATTNGDSVPLALVQACAASTVPVNPSAAFVSQTAASLSVPE
jgi:hypothetical protein